MESQILNVERQNKGLERPRIPTYLDFRKFMLDLYAFEKEQNPAFSFTTWAARGEFKSRSFLRLVMLGKRNLSPESIPQVLKALALNKKEGQYFTLLVNYNQASQFQSRDYYFQELMKVRGTQEATTLIRDSYRFLASQLPSRVQVLINHHDIDRTVAGLAGVLNVTPAQIEEALGHLEKMGLAVPDESGQWKGDEQKWQVPDDLGNLALQSFHKKSLEEAVRSLELPANKRHFSSLMLTLTETEYRDLQKQMTATLTAWLEGHSGPQGTGKKLYQINLNMIPVSQELIRHDHCVNESNK
jgi:uncharacterized protein (TIGR02147 family)